LNHHYRARLFERIQALPITALDDQRIGDAVYRLMYDTPAITAAAHRIVLIPIIAPLGILATAATIALVFPSHERLTWSALALLPLTLFASAPFAAAFRRRGRLSREVRETCGNSTTARRKADRCAATRSFPSSVACWSDCMRPDGRRRRRHRWGR
jgi:ABC-type multidrug transport system fused ATPase/permease subunit